MSRIKVYRPVPEATTGRAAERAPRGAVPEGAVLTIIDNTKPRGLDLLRGIAEGLRDRLGVSAVEVHTKPSAGAPIDADVARMLAVRSHLIISGLGD